MAAHALFVLLGTIAAVFGCGIGVPMTYFGVNRVRTREAVLDRVEKVEATITTARIRRYRDRDGSTSKYRYRPVIRFRYEYDGRTYESNRQGYNLLFSWSGSRAVARRTVRKYAEGDAVTAHVDPENPETGFLEVEDAKQGVATVALVGIGLASTSAGVTAGLIAVGAGATLFL